MDDLCWGAGRGLFWRPTPLESLNLVSKVWTQDALQNRHERNANNKEHSSFHVWRFVFAFLKCVTMGKQILAVTTALSLLSAENVTTSLKHSKTI